MSSAPADFSAALIENIKLNDAMNTKNDFINLLSVS
jgi:hypothetical protein